MTLVRLSDIRLNGGTQTREGLDFGVVSEYAEAYRAGVQFPPVEVVLDGTSYWLWDGFHRVNAAMSADREEIEANVRQGTREDAVWLSAGANVAHGLQRKPGDKRRAVMAVLAIPGFAEKTDREIGAHVGVTHQWVNEIRNERLAGTCQTGKPNSPAKKRTDKTAREAAKKSAAERREKRAKTKKPDLEPEIVYEPVPAVDSERLTTWKRASLMLSDSEWDAALAWAIGQARPGAALKRLLRDR